MSKHKIDLEKIKDITLGRMREQNQTALNEIFNYVGRYSRPSGHDEENLAA